MKPGLRYRLPDVPSPEQREAVLRQVHEFAVEWRLMALRGADLFNVVARLGIHLQEGASCVADFAEQRGITASSAREMVDLGKALFVYGEARSDIERGRMPVVNGSLLGRVDVEDIREEDDWLGWARAEKPRDFARRFHQRRDEVRQGKPVMALRAFVTYQGLMDFERARKLASRSARQVLTAGQTIGVVVDEYLDEHDPLREKGAERRLPDTSTPEAAASGSRYVPAQVARQVRMRMWDKCQVDFCSNEMFLTFSHRVPHREGGSREAENLDLLCPQHHFLYEQGIMLIEGTADDPVFKTVDGRVIGALDGDVDFYNAMAARAAARDNAESLERWKKKEAEAAALAKEAGPLQQTAAEESPPCDANGPPGRGVPPTAPLEREEPPPDPFGVDAAARAKFDLTFGIGREGAEEDPLWSPENPDDYPEIPF